MSSITEAQLRANRANAGKSTGPRTAVGKARACRNALKHGMFSKETLLDVEDADAFVRLRLEYKTALTPTDAVEREIVDRIITCVWKQRRIAQAERELLDRCAVGVAKNKAKEAKLDLEDLLDGLSDMALLPRPEQRKRIEGQGLAPTAGGGLAELPHEAEVMLSRFSTYEQRLQNTFHRCMRELRSYRKEVRAFGKQYAEACPYLEEADWSAERAAPASESKELKGDAGVAPTS